MQPIFSEFPWIYMLSLIQKKNRSIPKNHLGFGNQMFTCLLYLRLSNSIMDTPRPQKAA